MNGRVAVRHYGAEEIRGPGDSVAGANIELMSTHGMESKGAMRTFVINPGRISGPDGMAAQTRAAEDRDKGGTPHDP